MLADGEQAVISNAWNTPLYLLSGETRTNVLLDRCFPLKNEFSA